MLVARRLCLGGGRLIALRVLGSRTISPCRAPYFSLLMQREVSKRKHTLGPAPRYARFPAMLGSRGTWPNSSPYRLLGQSATSIPPEPCASRRLPRGPTSEAKARPWLVGYADIASRNDFPSPLAGEGPGERGTARSAVRWTYRPRGSAEKRRSRGVWKRALSEQGHSPASSRASPRLRASQGTPRSGARTSVCVSLVAGMACHAGQRSSFAQAKKVTRPAGRNSALNSAKQARSGERFHTNHSPSLTLPARGRGLKFQRVADARLCP